MAGFTNTTQVTELIPEITLEVAYQYQNRAIGQNLVTFQDVSGIPGVIVEFPRFTAVTGSTTVAETAAPDSHSMDLDTLATLTIARRSVYVVMGDLARKGASGNLAMQIGKAMGRAKVKQDDTAIFNVVTATTEYATSAGATNAAITLTNVLEGLLLLKKNEIEEQPVCVLHPEQYHDIRLGLTPIADANNAYPMGGEFMNEMVKEAFLSRMFGINWFESARISSGTVTATANVYNGLLFVASGIGYAHAWLEVNGVEAERDAATASTRLILNYADSAGVIHGPGVCKLYST